MTFRKIPIWKFAFFILLSVSDLCLTWVLIRDGDGAVYEGNPAANWFLARGGWLGLSGFKLAAVTGVAGLLVLIARYRPRLGGRLLTFACSCSLVVVVYSSSLAAVLEVRPERLGLEELRALEESNRRLAAEPGVIREYRRVRGEVGEDLIQRRRSLAEATAELARAEHAKNARWLKCLRLQYPGCSDEACLAANLVDSVIRSVAEDPSAAEVAHSLRREFRARYGRPLPSAERP